MTDGQEAMDQAVNGIVEILREAEHDKTIKAALQETRERLGKLCPQLFDGLPSNACDVVAACTMTVVLAEDDADLAIKLAMVASLAVRAAHRMLV